MPTDSIVEQMRIWDLIRLYRWLLSGEGDIIEVKDMGSNEYEVIVSIKKHKRKNIGSGIKGVYGLKKFNISWYDTQRITLKPPVNAGQLDTK